MTLRSSLLLILLLLLSNASVAQNGTDRAEVKWSDVRTEKENGEFGSILHVSDEHVFVLVDLKGSALIQVFDLDMNMVKQIDAETGGKDKYIWEDCLFRRDRMLMFTSLYEKKEKTLFATIYSLPDVTPLGTPQKLLSGVADGKDDQYAFLIGDQRSGEGFHVYTKTSKGYSGPSKILLFSYDLQPQGEAPENSISDAVPFEKDEYEFEDSKTLPDGSRLIMVRKYPEKSEKRRRKREGKPSYDMVFVHQGRNGGKGTVTPLNSNDKFLQDLKLLALENGDIVCAGLWGSKNSWEIRGAFFIRIDPMTKQVVHENFSEFSDDLITQYMSVQERKGASRSDRKGEDMEMAHYDLRKLIARDDGGAVLVAEQYRYDIIEHTNSNGVTKYVNTYLYRDILVVSIDPSGIIQWGTKIPKLQFTKDDDGRYSSYAMMVKGSHIYFLFNDNLKNLSLRSGEKIQLFKTAGSEAVITLATVDPQGIVHREALLDPGEQDAVLIPENCFQVGNDRLFIHGSSGRNYKFGSVRFL